MLERLCRWVLKVSIVIMCLVYIAPSALRHDK